MAFQKIVKNLSNLDVTSNEYQARQTLQRIIDRLYQNDLALAQFYTDIFGKFYIYSYDRSVKYKYNELVWFKCDSECTANTIANLGAGLHVLRCNVSEVQADSLCQYPGKSFDTLGWKDLNVSIDILEEFGIKKTLEHYIQKQFKDHASDTSLHPYGKLSYNPTSSNTLSSKIMNRDFGNANPNRDQVFFPYETISLNPTDQLLNGYGRCYDNGLLEFDLIFRLSYAGHKEIDKEYNIDADIISCNNLNLESSSQDSAYFNANGDGDIFCHAESSLSADLDGIVELNKNDYCNVYSAEIEFTQDSEQHHKFADTSYMIFTSDILCQDRDTNKNALNIGANQMVFVKKTTSGFTALYVTYPNQANYSTTGYNAKHSGLMSNSFHCHVVGRWK